MASKKKRRSPKKKPASNRGRRGFRVVWRSRKTGRFCKRNRWAKRSHIVIKKQLREVTGQFRKAELIGYFVLLNVLMPLAWGDTGGRQFDGTEDPSEVDLAIWRTKVAYTVPEALAVYEQLLADHDIIARATEAQYHLLSSELYSIHEDYTTHLIGLWEGRTPPSWIQELNR